MVVGVVVVVGNAVVGVGVVAAATVDVVEDNDCGDFN